MMKSYFPPEWDDDERMRVLMRAMPDIKETAAYNARLTFWTANLHNWIRNKEGGVSFTIQDAQMAFRKGTQVPQCFVQVLQHMIRQGEIISYEDLKIQGNLSESWVSWSKRVFVATPSKWAWNKVQDTIGSKSFENKVFVDWVVLQEMSDAILSEYFLAHHDKYNDCNLLTVDELFKMSKTLIHKITLEDLDLIIHFLIQKGKAAVLVHEDSTLVKFAKPGHSETPTITINEVAEHKLIVAESKLQERITDMKLQIGPLRQLAKQAIQSGSKAQALTLLKRRKRLEKSLETSLLAQENVLTCLQQLQISKLNIEVLQAFQLGVTSLRQSITKTGPAEDISEKMDALQDVLDECNDISDSLSSGMKTTGVDDDDDSLEMELNDLLKNVKINVTEEDVNFPSVPTYNPLDFVSTSPKRDNVNKGIVST